MDSLFLWYYCLSIPRALLFLVLATAAYLLFRHWWGSARGWKAANAVFWVLWLVVVLVATLMDRTPDAVRMPPIWQPFHSYRLAFSGAEPELFRSNLMNVILFYPLGLVGTALLPRKKEGLWLVAALFLCSVGIELLQYGLALGQAETDDVLHNTLGAALGVWIASGFVNPFWKKVCGGGKDGFPDRVDV